jgi:hypothetical protein
MIFLPIPTIFWMGGGMTFQLLNGHEVNYVRQTEIYAIESLVPEPSSEIAVQILAELNQAENKTCDEIHKSTNTVTC